MRTYLSIDIDFWNNLEAAERVLTKLLLRRGDIPTIAVMNHQQLLPMVNESNADVLVNIDEHSDLCDTSVSRVGSLTSNGGRTVSMSGCEITMGLPKETVTMMLPGGIVVPIGW
jgi:hypothetical protein